MNIWLVQSVFTCSYFMAPDKLWVSFALPVAGPSCVENCKSHVQRGAWERLLCYSTKCRLSFWFWTQRKNKRLTASLAVARDLPSVEALKMPCLYMCWSYFFTVLSILMPSIKFLGGKSSACANLTLLLSVLQQLVIFLLGVFPESCIFQWSL